MEDRKVDYALPNFGYRSSDTAGGRLLHNARTHEIYTKRDQWTKLRVENPSQISTSIVNGEVRENPIFFHYSYLESRQ